MENEKNNTRRLPWQVLTLLFMATVLALLALTLFKPVWGLFAALLLLLTAFVGSVLKKGSRFDGEEIEKSSFVQPLSKQEMRGSQRLLRYATAVLAFLSLLTTASGMKSFVFGEAWLAYLGSFAVQSILIVFSLLLCRFFVQITVLPWSSYIKRTVNIFMILFFCTALLVSSTFSFSYIANNAYKKSWPSDSETILQNFLLNAAYELRTENERRGELIQNSLNETAKERLGGAIEASQNQSEVYDQQNLAAQIQAFSFQSLAKGAADIDEESLKSTFSQYESEIPYLCEQYEQTYVAGYHSAIDTYNQIVEDISSWKGTMPQPSTILAQTKAMEGTIENTNQNLDNLKETIVTWKTYHLNNDLSSVRSRFATVCDALQIQLSSLNTAITEIRVQAEKLNGEAENETAVQLNDLLSQIYLLGVGDSVETEPLIEQINALAIKASESDTFQSEDIQNIVTLKNELLVYTEYLELKQNLDTFIQENLQNTYQIKIGDTDEAPLAITEAEWESKRNQDFNIFYSLVKGLPDSSEFSRKEQEQTRSHTKEESEEVLTETASYTKKESEEVLTETASYTKKGSEEVLTEQEYDTNAVLEQASTLQRDLLGQTTDFEKAFNYFKYRFPVMAYFSAFVAVFFDLGSFFTGCFLYATEYFEKSKQ